MGETGYTKPGPPTPGRNKSLGEYDLHHLTDNDYDDDNYDDNDDECDQCDLNCLLDRSSFPRLR